MLEHLNSTPAKPVRAVIIGAGGFVGGTIRKKLETDGVPVLALTRRELDLLGEGATKKLGQMLRPTDSVVMVSAVAPVKSVPMLMQNLRMVEAVCAALAEKPVSHLVYISSDAVYTDDANPVNESSHCAPATLHGRMHAARELMLKNATAAPVAPVFRHYALPQGFSGFPVYAAGGRFGAGKVREIGDEDGRSGFAGAFA